MYQLETRFARITDGGKTSYFTAAAAVQGKLFATKEGLSGMRRAVRLAEDTAVIELGVRGHG